MESESIRTPENKQRRPDSSQFAENDDGTFKKRLLEVPFIYKGAPVTVEVKSLQTHSIRKVGSECIGKFQCDASDRRQVTLPNRRKIETTCLVVDEFDLLAVNLFEFEQEWRFAFAKNTDLPRSRFPKYTPQQRKYLLATLMEVTWPLKPPFGAEPFRLLDEIALEKTRKPRS